MFAYFFFCFCSEMKFLENGKDAHIKRLKERIELLENDYEEELEKDELEYEELEKDDNDDNLLHL